MKWKMLQLLTSLRYQYCEQLLLSLSCHSAKYYTISDMCSVVFIMIDVMKCFASLGMG